MLMKRVQRGESREQSSQEGGGVESGALIGEERFGHQIKGQFHIIRL